MHSWRVLVVPFLDFVPADFDRFAKAYHFDEPWNSPKNQKVAARLSDRYTCPVKYIETPGMTDYVAVTGPGTVWADGRSCKRQDISDGPANTLMLVEMADSEIPWNSPFDLTLEEALSSDPKATKTIRSYHWLKYDNQPQLGGNVAFADGRVESVRGRLTTESFQALTTIAGHEPVDVDHLEALIVPGSAPITPPLWSHLIGWSILVVSFVFLVSRPLPEAWTRRDEKLPEKSVE